MNLDEGASPQASAGRLSAGKSNGTGAGVTNRKAFSGGLDGPEFESEVGKRAVRWAYDPAAYDPLSQVHRR